MATRDELYVSPDWQPCDWSYSCREIVVFSGPDLSTVRIIEDPQLLPKATGIGDQMEFADVDGDGAIDLITSAPWYFDERLGSVGALGILYGPDLDETRWDFVVPRGAGLYDGANFDVVAGDVNHDGRAEILLGQRNWDAPSWASNGRAVLLDYSSRDPWYRFGWPYPAEEPVTLTADLAQWNAGDLTIAVEAPWHRLAGVLAASLQVELIPFGEFTGKGPSEIPALFVDVWTWSSLHPFAATSQTGRCRAEVDYHYAGLPPNLEAVFPTAFFQALCLDPWTSELVTSRAVGVQLKNR